MKNKILEALKQGHKNLGLSEEAFERVAAFGETFIKEEGDIANFVKGAEVILKAEQSKDDKNRTELGKLKGEYEGRIAELEAKLNGTTAGNGGDGVKTTGWDATELSKMIANAVTEANKPLQEANARLAEELSKFKGEQAHKEAMSSAEARFNGNDWVKKYPDEGSDAWERAVEVNALSGNKMTADELHEKAMGYFSKAVKRKGEDVTKPFKAEGTGDSEPDFSPFDRAVASKNAEMGIVSQEGAQAQ